MSDETAGTASHAAFGAPGMQPRWTSSSKDGVGTAYSTSSKVWFTTSHGILNEIYYPTIDSPQIRDVQVLVSDGEDWFQEEKRDLAYEIECLDKDALGYRITSRDPHGRYSIVKDVIADPHLPCVLVHVTLDAAPEWEGRLRAYVLLAPHLSSRGWGNSAERLRVSGMEVVHGWHGQSHVAFGVDSGFTKVSCGYAGTSDGWQDLSAHKRMEWQFDRAEDGNIAMIGEVDLSKGPRFLVGISFGRSRHAALSTLLQSLAIDFGDSCERFVEQWRRVGGEEPRMAETSGDDGRLYRISRALLLAHEDKTYAGAVVASASIPWGDTKGDDDLGGYHLVWTRDMVQSVTGLLACGDFETPRRALVYLACSQHADGGFAQNCWLDGTAYWSGLQLDEVAFPILLAWRLWQGGQLEGFDPYPMVSSAAAFLVRHAPVTQQERWEELAGYSPSTLAATISALICAASFARDRGDEREAAFLEDFADFLESHIERWTVTRRGELLQAVPRHYVRILPVDPDRSAADEDVDSATVVLPNLPPGTQHEFAARNIVDGGFLELVRYGVRAADDTLIQESVRVVDSVLKTDTPFGPVWHRYNHDGYGQRPDGGAFDGWGRGRGWPLLTGERGHYELAGGHDPGPYLRAMEGFASRGGMLPEQVWDEDRRPSHRLEIGRPTGSAMPLMWAHAEYVKLLRSAVDGHVFDRISVVADRYLSNGGRQDLEIWTRDRRPGEIRAGDVLRIQAASPFRVHWTCDEWEHSEDVSSQSSSLGISWHDIQVNKTQEAPVRFTLYWPERDAWEGCDYSVRVRSGD